ncbi:MAG: glycoside hydrolase/phage tail family protein [Hyphomonadaceae bacterium]
MAQLVLSTIGQAIGSRLAPAAFRAVGAQIGRALGSTLGRSIDDQIFGTARRAQGPRLTDLHTQGSTEGASIPCVYGRVRIAGQVIWAARFKERATTEEIGGGKGGGARTRVTNYSYSLSFAVGLCEGEIARIGRVWANGEPVDLSAVSYRLHLGTEDQAPDPLIEAIEGAERAPAYRGLAYIVFEDLPLDAFGNMMPQLSFEIVRPTPAIEPRLEDMARAVCLIPGSGEFVYASEPVRRVIGPGREAAENMHAIAQRANFDVALDQLAADLPNVESVLLVVSWFGTDLRCGECAIKPGVEIAEKDTRPLVWRVNGVARNDAHVVSQIDGAPAYGGTPSDQSVMQAIAALKARGYRVGLYPFILMDVPADNALADPYGGAAQAAYPWRGRINLHPAPGEPGTPDKTSAAADQIADFFGEADVGDFGANANGVTYSGPAEWSFRRFILHHAKLADAAGGVDFFVMGSEMRGVTTARSAASTYPAVAALKTLAGDVRAILGSESQITYAADWSEYFGHQPQDGSGDVHFHLDPLWADSNIDAVGIDWYPPLTDWRDGATHLDAEIADTIYDPEYLEGRIEAGENYDYFYADDADRAAQIRTPITDGAYAKPWVYRAKDVRGWWGHAHYDRPGGVEAGAPTAWVAESKPIWLTELGCPAVDKGANAPNLFIDDKSSESALPPFSAGGRDDLIQRRALEAYLRHWADDDAIDADNIFLWCWDARPHPAFPARADVWSDASSWRLGHWLSGRVGLSELGQVVNDICLRAGVHDADVSALTGAVGGYVVDAPTSARDALEPLMAAYDFFAAERDGRIVFAHRSAETHAELMLDDLIDLDAGAAFATRADSADAPIEARVTFLDAGADYRIATVSARRRDAAEGGAVQLEAPLSLDEAQGEALAKRVLAEARAGAETLELSVSPQKLALEAGDVVSLSSDASPGAFEIVRIEDAEARKLTLRRTLSASTRALHEPLPAPPPLPALASSPDLLLLDLPPLPGAEEDQRPLAAVYAEPWLGAHAIHAGADASLFTERGEATQAAIVGELVWALWPGPVGRWDEGNRTRVTLSGAVSSVTKAALLNGANVFAVEGEAGWEILQARMCTLADEDTYELSGFLRGLLDTGAHMGAPHPIGARIVKLDTRLARLNVQAHEWGEALAISAPAFGGLPTGADATQAEAVFGPQAARPFAPVHVRAVRDAAGDVTFSWIRAARIGGDSWAAGEPPIGEPAELYRLEALDGGDVARSWDVSLASATYSEADQIADFGAPLASISLRVAQIAADGLPGRWAERTLFL